MTTALKKHKRATISLGTMVEVTLWLQPEEHPQPFFKAAYQAIHHVHQTMRVHDATSDLGRYFHAAPNTAVKISAATLAVLRFSENLWLQTGGLFDVCIGNVLVQYDYLPATLSVKNNLAHQLLPRNQALKLEQTHENGSGYVIKMPNTLIDLGGVAKGYAVDCAIHALKSLDVKAALVNAGGDMRIVGEVTESIHLRVAAGQYRHLIDLSNAALASSGMPTNHAESREYLPIVNPLTQQCLPANHKIISVLATNAMTADAMTKLAWLNALDPALCQRYNVSVLA